MLLTAQDVTRRFSGICAVDGVSLFVNRGETLGIIGTNGAGKTTLFNILTGFDRCDSGRILYKEKNIVKWSRFEFVKHGIARTFQNLRLFYDMTVEENVLISALACKQDKDLVTRLLKRAGLYGVRKNLASSLPYGDMRKVELVRAAATGAELLFLDEPSAAMTRAEALALDKLIRELKETLGITVVLIEHNMELVRQSCDRVYAMDRGRVIAAGTPREVLSSPAVRESMLPHRKGDLNDRPV